MYFDIREHPNISLRVACDYHTQMKPRDRMLAGSVGKTFAAATALQLVKEGKIGLDDRIEKYLGREPWFSRLPNATDHCPAVDEPYQWTGAL